MKRFIYDGTFEGLLTVVYSAYETKMRPDEIISGISFQESLFCEDIYITTCREKAEKVWTALSKKLTKESLQFPYRAFLSEQKEEKLIFNFIVKTLSSNVSIEMNFGDDIVLAVRKLQQKVTKEACRMIEFIRFQKTADKIYFASIAPKYNVLPLILNHFESRFPDQEWIIYDLHRKYGAHYNKQSTTEISFNTAKIDKATGVINSNIADHEEAIYKTLWQEYFNSINIADRKNLKCQMNFMPKRFWQYMTEKQRIAG